MHFPALSDGYAYLDGAGGTQMPEAVIEAMADASRRGLANVGGVFPASDRADSAVEECRAAIADLVSGEPAGVVLGPNMTTLTYRVASALSKQWAPGDEVIVTQLDHDANIRPWIQAADRVGAVVRWATIDTSTGDLPTEQFQALVNGKTRLVAVTAASNLTGIKPNVAEIAAIAHNHRALLFVDGVHATAHQVTDIRALGADFYATSAYKWYGPHVGAIIADPGLLERFEPDKLLPQSDVVPERYEWGTPSFANLVGVAAAVDELASLSGDIGTRRERIRQAMGTVEQREQTLFLDLLKGLSELPSVSLYGQSSFRAPTAFFRVADLTPQQLAGALARRQVNVWHGDNFAIELCRALGLDQTGGAVRASLAIYNQAEDVHRLVAAVGEIVDSLATSRHRE